MARFLLLYRLGYSSALSKEASWRTMLSEPAREAKSRPFGVSAAERLLVALQSPANRMALGILIGSLLLVPLWLLACRLYEGQLLQEQRAHVVSDLTATTHALEENFAERLAVVTALRASATVSPWANLSTNRVDGSGREFLAGIEGVTRLWLAPNGRVNYVYPLEGGEVLIGYSLLDSSRPGVAEAVKSAINTREILLAPPDSLGFPGDDWVAWQSVFQGERFWGIVGIRMDTASLFRPIVVSDHSSWMEMALLDHNGEIVLGARGIRDADPIVHEIALPTGAWQVMAIPRGGWTASIQDKLLVFQAGSFAILTLLATLVYVITSRQWQLSRAVADRTHEISRINQELKEDIAKREQAEAERERLLTEMEQRVLERTHHLKTLYDVTAVAGASLDANEILERSLERIVGAVEGEVGFVHLYHPTEGALKLAATHNFAGESCGANCPPADEIDTLTARCWAFENAERLVVPNTAVDTRTGVALARLGARAHVGVPIRGKERPLGVVCVFRSLDRPFTAEEVSLLTAICGHLGVALENAGLYATVHEKAILEERQRLASDLHDSVTQLMYSVTLLAEASRQTLAGGDGDRADQYLVRLGDAAQQALKEMRLQLYELRYSGLSPEGLVATLQKRLDSVERRAGLSAELAANEIEDVPQPVAEALNRIAQEALNNTLKHAAANAVAIRIECTANTVTMEIVDDGRGFDPRSVKSRGGLGLQTMQDRAKRIGAVLSIQSAPGAGTTVRVDVECDCHHQEREMREGTGMEVEQVWG